MSAFQFISNVLIYSRKGQEELLPASLVVSSQISGYSGGDVTANESVEITFPIKVHSATCKNSLEA